MSLDIIGVNTKLKNLDDCLNYFIREEKIEDYHCEKCDKKITNIKQFTVDKNNSDIPSEYYDYDLQGILIHSGTAQYLILVK